MPALFQLTSRLSTKILNTWRLSSSEKARKYEQAAQIISDRGGHCAEAQPGRGPDGGLWAGEA